ncbi:MAG: 50S ribosomal protein L11 methyltransferase [Patescibacteria group bacterium]
MVDFLIFLGFAFMISLFYFFVAGFFRSPFVPSNRKTIAKMLLVAKIRPGEKVVDLGCGDGRIVFRAEKFFGANAEGYEISVFVWLLAQANRWLKSTKAKIYRRNFFTADLSQADVVFCYLLPEVMLKLSPKFKKELKPGARIISASFSLPGFEPQKIYPAEARAAKIFIYEQGLEA